jgi:hypothetical protein
MRRQQAAVMQQPIFHGDGTSPVVTVMALLVTDVVVAADAVKSYRRCGSSS